MAKFWADGLPYEPIASPDESTGGVQFFWSNGLPFEFLQKPTAIFLIADSGTYLLTGQDATLSRQITISVDAGNYTFSPVQMRRSFRGVNLDSGNAERTR